MMFDPSYNPISARYRFARLPYAHMGGEAAEHEVDFLEFVWQQHAVRTVRDVLDVGCGTGRHSIELARRGYRVTGVDLSQAMLDVLQEQMPAGLDVTLRRLDMRELDYDQAFDALICMNSTFAYMLTDEDIARALSAFQRALRPDAILFIDVMNYLSLLGRYRPTDFGNIARWISPSSSPSGTLWTTCTASGITMNCWWCAMATKPTSAGSAMTCAC